MRTRESGLWQYSGWGTYYRGIFQLGKHIVALAVYGNQPFDPFQNRADQIVLASIHVYPVYDIDRVWNNELGIVCPDRK